jgi:hypothetical protein
MIICTRLGADRNRDTLCVAMRHNLSEIPLIGKSNHASASLKIFHVSFTTIKRKMNSANDHLNKFFGTSRYHQYLYGHVLTDGVVALTEMFHCYWYLDIICSYAVDLKDHPFQVWTLQKRSDSSAIVECTDRNGTQLARQEIPWTDFAADTAIVWKEDHVLLLPSEH